MPSRRGDWAAAERAVDRAQAGARELQDIAATLYATNARAGPGEIVVSDVTRQLSLGSGLRFAERARTPLNGLPGTWELATVIG
ncbi:MAG: hypothetical protein GEV08_19550 [Acidimicrobiia bacterium]|nr:hypothetical protein [Acidimicrobiia bacterium]